MRAGSAIASGTRHVFGVGLQAILIAAIIATVALAMSAVYKPAGFVAGLDSADAAGRTSARITVPDGVFAGRTTATANPGDEGTWVFAECKQAGIVVYQQYVRVDPSTHQATLTLGPTPSWSGGAASCSAQEGTWFKGTRWRAVATTTFQVSD